jgi:hypothetical protein
VTLKPSLASSAAAAIPPKPEPMIITVFLDMETHLNKDE